MGDRIARFFLAGYSDFAPEIQVITRYLLYLCLAGECGFSVILINGIWFKSEFIEVLTTIIGIFLIAYLLVVFRKKPLISTIIAHQTQHIYDKISNIIFYKITNGGPAVIFSEYPLQEKIEASSAVYLYTMIGQGSQYRTGFFGPVPFGLKDACEIAYIYATLIVDASLEDPRFHKQNYILIALVASFDEVLNINRQHLESRIVQSTKNLSDLSALTVETYSEIIAKIRSQEQ
ncbi:MAG TPA: hypothetical protein VKK79_02850 [Candidatus Lokiarchaeia archaeon]|nr:hypothetical protein [Candidatus Lokiarchaeia archaeon]